MKDQNLPEDVIELSLAEDYAGNWREIAEDKFGTGYIKAFNIPMHDFEAIKNKGAVGIRAYMANTKPLGENGEMKLLLVGTDVSGKDLINYEAEEYVYDFTTPCPAMCSPVPSPLNPGN